MHRRLGHLLDVDPAAPLHTHLPDVVRAPPPHVAADADVLTSDGVAAGAEFHSNRLRELRRSDEHAEWVASLAAASPEQQRLAAAIFGVPAALRIQAAVRDALARAGYVSAGFFGAHSARTGLVLMVRRTTPPLPPLAHARLSL